MEFINERRLAKFKNVAHKRQGNLTVILENVHDPHNIGAVMRSCDSIGIYEIFVLYTEDHLGEDHIKLGKRSSAGARKWVNVHVYKNVDACFNAVREKYDKILATHLSEDGKDLYELDLTASVALLFGNENAGVSKEVLSKVDGNFIIPQVGMVESLNISVACAVSLYEAFRQRKLKGFYDENQSTSATQKQGILNEYVKRHRYKVQVNKPEQDD